MCIVTKNAVMKQLQVAGVLAAAADWSSGTADMASSTAAPIIPNATISSTDRIARAHQASFYARGLLKIIAVSEKGAGAHGNVPRAGGCSTDGTPETAHTWQRREPQRAMRGRWTVQVAAETPDDGSHLAATGFSNGQEAVL